MGASPSVENDIQYSPQASAPPRRNRASGQEQLCSRYRGGITAAAERRLRADFRFEATDVRRSESGKARYAYGRQSALEDPANMIPRPAVWCATADGLTYTRETLS